MTTRGQINSNFYQIVNVDSNGNPTSVKLEYVPESNTANYANFAGSSLTAGTVTTASQPNITSLGTLTGLNSTGIVNLSTTSNISLGTISNIHISGGNSGYVLQTDGAGNLTWTAQTGGGGNGVPGGANTQVQYNDAGAFGGSSAFTFNETSNTLTVTNIAGNGSGLTQLTGANVTGTVANANYAAYAGNATIANSANSVTVANVSGIGNIATVNLDGNVSNILHGNGFWGPESSAGNANYANFAGTVLTNAQPNITSVGTLVSLDITGNITGPDVISFDTSNGTGTLATGQMSWDVAERTMSVGMLNGVTQQIGLETYIVVKASAAISDGQVVMFTGANGDNVLAAPANAASVGFRADYIIGIATQDIALNGFGYITVFGSVHGLNTNAYTVGDILWYDPTSTTGGLTNTQPTDPNYQIQMAAVTKKSGGDGHIQVRVMVVPSLNLLTDVTITTPTTGQALIYNGSNVWINGNPNVANYAGSANTAATVTTNAQPNITSTGTLSNLDVSGNVTASYFVSNVTTGTAPFTVTSTTTVANLSVNNASHANISDSANSVSVANVSGIGNIATINLDGSSTNVLYGNGTFAGVTATSANFANYAGNVTVASQPNITSLGTLSSLSVTANVAAGNFTTVGNIRVGGAVTGVTMSATGGILYFNRGINVAQSLNYFGGIGNLNVTGGNSGEFVRTDGAGNLTFAAPTAAPAGSNTQIQFNDAGSLGGNANLTFNKTTSVLTVTGNIATTNANLGNLSVANYYTGTLTTAAQPNITSTGTLTSLAVSGNANIVNTNLVKFGETVLNGGVSVSGTLTPDAAAGTIYTYTLAGNVTISSAGNAVAGTSMTLILTQGTGGNKILTSTMKFAGGSKTLSTAAGAIDIISLFYDGTSYYAVLSKGYA